MKNSVFFILIIALFLFIVYKAVRFIFPFMVPILIFFDIYIFLNSLFGSKKEIPPKNVYRGEVVKDVELRVVDDENDSEKSKINKENS